MSARSFDIAIAGDGPAGLALGSACARRGLKVAVIGKGHEWIPTYGCWADDVASLAHVDGHAFERCFENPHVVIAGKDFPLHRTYVKVHRTGLRDALLKGLSDAGGEYIIDDVSGGSRTGLQGQHRRYESSVVFDATGHNPVLTDGLRHDGEAAQTAYGVLATCDSDPLEGREMVLMDFDVEDANSGRTPTFLYGMKLGPQLYFLEETVLTMRPPVSIGELKRRLEDRLEARGVKIVEVHEEERCFIPMGTRIPTFQGVHAFGAAAGFVHPATGYMLADTLRRAERVADVIAAQISKSEIAHEAIQEAIWPPDRRWRRSLYILGMNAVIGMDAEKTHRFFQTFFSLSQAQWSAYMSDSLRNRELVQTMLAIFMDVDLGLKAALTGAALRHFTPKRR